MQRPLTVSPPESRIRVLRPSARFTAIAALLVGATYFGLGTVATKGAMDGIPPLTLAAGRFGIAALVLTALCRARGVRPVYDGRAVLLDLTGVAAPFAFQNLGLRDAGAGSATLLIEGGLPLMAAVLGVAVLRERVSGSRVAGLLLGVGGVAIVAVTELGGGMPLSGGLFSLAAALALAIYTVLGRKIYRGGFSLAVLTGGAKIGTLMLGPLVSVEVGAGGMPTPDLGDLLLMLFLGVVCSAATQILWVHGMTHLDATEIGIFGTFMLVVGITAAATFLGEAITLPQIVGAALIAAGMVVTARTTPLRRPSLVRWLRHAAPVAEMTTGRTPFTDVVVPTAAPLAAESSPVAAMTSSTYPMTLAPKSAVQMA